MPRNLLFVCNRRETMQYHSSRPIKEVRPSPYTGVPKAGVIISPVSTDGVTTVLATG